ncbi:MAG: hypothetical protein A3J08_01490 [Candidatus Lloydbacteria bacterium RIFCSPLOWO2_02_FULL_51_11]|uniref:Plasmid stabilization protein n=2 Tax=Candidatus Lloydiibacteriota TaxID=1817910 RepID=A0A1G2DQA8_9BACT|nr:MAG: hypothetical protein A3J08_01490 [Candidatus Lloydbacteria bacterium RIFCSPLOWO2_02_FULL_51_11]
MKVLFKPTFVRQFDKLESVLQEEVEEKIELLKDKENHKLLKIHKLHGRLAKWYSFSVNYRIRIIFSYLSKQEIVLLAIGDHEVYDK